MGKACMTSPTDKELDQGYSICFCGAYKLHQAGFEAEMYQCASCKEMVAAPFEIFDKDKQELGAEVLSK